MLEGRRQLVILTDKKEGKKKQLKPRDRLRSDAESSKGVNLRKNSGRKGEKKRVPQAKRFYLEGRK